MLSLGGRGTKSWQSAWIIRFAEILNVHRVKPRKLVYLRGEVND